MSANDYNKLFPGHSYPKRTAAAAAELVARGLKANVATLDYLVNKGVVQEPHGEKRHREWQRWHILQAAQYLADQDAFTPEGWRWVIDDVDPAQDVRAFRAACEKAPHLLPDPGYFVRTVRPAGPRYANQPCDPPGLAPQRAYAVVSYEPISLDELAEWRDALDEARAEGVMA
jgi:hypothetical protein